MGKKVGISSKLMLGVMGAVLGLIIVGGFALEFLKDSMLKDRIDKVRNLTEVSQSIATGFHQRAVKGEFDDLTAQSLAKDALRAMRYDGENYIFI